MGDNSHIEWTSATWNPTVGCSKVSQGCKHCYAELMHARLLQMSTTNKYQDPFRVVKLWQPALLQPFKWKQPKLIFVNSMSDLFHEDLSTEEIRRVFDVMVRADWHTYQVLTKRSERLLQLADSLPWPPHIWMGVSVESPDYLFRIHHLVQTPAAIRFLSIEPLLAPISALPLSGIHWAIVGGESGSRARPMKLKWARDIRDQCQKARVPFFLKQLGGQRGKRGGAEAILDGRLWHQLPTTGTEAACPAGM